jgi:hypothetical protein
MDIPEPMTDQGLAEIEELASARILSSRLGGSTGRGVTA